MKIYRVTLYAEGASGGYEYHTNKTDAEKSQKAADIENDSAKPSELYPMEVEISKRGIINFLNKYCSYPDNG